MRVKCYPFIAVCALFCSHISMGDGLPGTGPREWSNTEGRKIVAEYLGVRSDSVMVRMEGGKIVPIPLAKLSETDKAFVRDHPMGYREAWKGWPGEVRVSTNVVVTETAAKKDEYVYQTQNFRFHVDGNLGAPLMKDLAQVFELTHALHLKSPFGLLAKPEGDRFEASLFGTSQTYRAQGGPRETAGVYLPKKKVFLAPLDLMGVKVDSSVWRRIPRSRHDSTTVIHELTHMLTHEMLLTLPVWVNEGYAEYIANIPVEGNAFQTGRDKIREGVIESFVLDYEKWFTGRNGRIPKIGPADKSKFLRENLPDLPPLSTVLGVTDKSWHAAGAGGSAYAGSKYQYSDMMSQYRTAHLIIYHFLHLDGGDGISKLCRYVERRRRTFSEIEAYRADFAEYERKMEEFVKLPGVRQLDDGRFSHPANLTPPKAPEATFGTEETIDSSGMEILLAGETPEALGGKIEEALRNDLGLPLKFTKSLTRR